uniref:Uncharacterized protein n=1 Tax=Arundo donax TaxID=35708 RepID=A0A0A9CLF2_ARUDO
MIVLVSSTLSQGSLLAGATIYRVLLLAQLRRQAFHVLQQLFLVLMSPLRS